MLVGRMDGPIAGAGKELKALEVQAAEHAAERRMDDYRRKREARLAAEEQRKADRRAEYEDKLANNEGLLVSKQMEDLTAAMEQTDLEKSRLQALKNAEDAVLDDERLDRMHQVDDYLEHKFNSTQAKYAREEKKLQRERDAKAAEKERKKKEKEFKKAEEKRKKAEYEKRREERAKARAAEAAAKAAS